MTGPLTRTGRFAQWFSHPFTSQEPHFYKATFVCLLASGIFWQMNALNKTYTTRIDCPLQWRYDTAHYVSLRPLPTMVPVTVKGQGWRLLRANLGMGIRPAMLRPLPHPGTRYLPASAWKQSLRTALEGLEVNDWGGDTLRLTFDRLTTRWLNLTLVPDSGQTYAASLTPARVAFRGPASVIAALPNPYPVAVPATMGSNGTEDISLVIQAPVLVRPSSSRVHAHLSAQSSRPHHKPRHTSAS